MKLIFSRIVYIFSLFLVLSVTVKAVNLEEANIPANNDISLSKAADIKYNKKILSGSIVLINDETGALIFSKNPNKKMYPASITKVMTALLAIENSNMDDKVKYSKDAVYSIEPGSSSIGMKPGEYTTMKDCLKGLLMMSSNENANAIAEHISGNRKDFAKLMTKRAKELGCKHTKFLNAHGLHDKNHYTTAYDMSLITREALRHEDFRDIISTYIDKIPKTNLVKDGRYLCNNNKMINKNGPYYYKKCTGGKTGYTDQAYHTFVNTAKDKDFKLIVVSMRSQGRPSKWIDTKNLFEFGFKNFKNQDLLEVNQNFNLESSLIGMDNNTKDKYSYIGDYKLTLPKKYDISKLSAEVGNENKENNAVIYRINYYYNGAFCGSSEIKREFEDVNIQNSNTNTNNSNNKIKSKHIMFYVIASVVFILIVAIFVIKRFLFKRKIKVTKFNFKKKG